MDVKVEFLLLSKVEKGYRFVRLEWLWSKHFESSLLPRKEILLVEPFKLLCRGGIEQIYRAVCNKNETLSNWVAMCALSMHLAP